MVYEVGFSMKLPKKHRWTSQEKERQTQSRLLVPDRCQTDVAISDVIIPDHAAQKVCFQSAKGMASID